MAWCACCEKNDGNMELVQPKEMGSKSPGVSGFNGLVPADAAAKQPKEAAVVSNALHAESEPVQAKVAAEAAEAAEAPAEDAFIQATVVEVPEKKEINDPPKAVAAEPEARPVKVVEGEQFQVEILKENRRMCVDINYHDGKTLLITKVNEGPVMDHNMKNPALEVASGDRILVINGVSEDSQAMLEQCKTAHKLDMTIQRRTEKTITLHRIAGQELGVQVAKVDRMALMVTKVIPGALVDKHNQAQPQHDIRREDRIIAINGVRSDGARLLEMISAEGTLELTLRRIWPEGTPVQ